MAPRRRRSTTSSGPLLAIAVVLIVLVGIFRAIAAHPVVFVLLLLAAGAILVAVMVRRTKRHQAQQQIRAARSFEIAPYHRMSALEFEHALAFLCQRDGCRDVQVVGGAGDLAADVIATTPDGRRIVIQAKRYGPTTTVGSGDVQKVNGTYRDFHGGHLAAIVTTSRFTKPALTAADKVGIRCYDQHDLAGWASRTGPAPWH
ncbi:restriction endonuclease [Kitasatospora mediocidica]|uniref:restriction endonuclease n=1 Tax=Kitasatospora mediocidica TaxID=58352 RepID=UPI00068D5936|nr:restriction endonuclease [Kitasatospora mediocidica]